MRTLEDIEAYLDRSSYPHRELEEGTWLVEDPSGVREQIIVRVHDGLALFRVNVLDVSEVDPARKMALYETMLSLNANDMVHGAYGVAEGQFVLTATLRMENLDFNEFVGTLDDFGVALSKHIARFGEHRTARNDAVNSGAKTAAVGN